VRDGEIVEGVHWSIHRPDGKRVDVPPS
jgi:hypothetical protein